MINIIYDSNADMYTFISASACPGQARDRGPAGYGFLGTEGQEGRTGDQSERS